MRNSNQIFGALAWPPPYFARAKELRVLHPRLLIGLLVCAGGFILPACRGPQPQDSKAGSSDTPKAAFTTPPFSTKEPERYQALRVTSITETGGAGNSSSSQTHQVAIARDGDKRREEYSAGTSGQIVYLEITAGRYIVLPAGRLYADLGSASQQNDSGNRPYDSPDDLGLSPDQLLNESQAPATYEKVGAETLAGRVTTKYRVVMLTPTDSQNETFIWVDEALGLPVRSEAISKSNQRSWQVTMELKDVKLEVDESLFSWPSDYRKVEARLIFDLIREAVNR